MSTPAELLTQSLAKLQSANRIDGNKNSYRKDNPSEYTVVMAYLQGGTRPTSVTSDMGMGLVLEEDARRALLAGPTGATGPGPTGATGPGPTGATGPGPTGATGTPPAPTGVLRAHFTDFYTSWGSSSTDHNGQIFQNRASLGVNFGLQTLHDPETPWASINALAITEVTTPEGPGFRFRANPEMLASSGGKKTEIYENGASTYGAPMVRGVPYTDEISFYVRFPSSGNPNGFPPSSDWNVFWQHDTSKISGFGVDGDPSHNPPRFYCGLLRANNTNPPGGRVQPNWNVQMDVAYFFRFIVKWSTGADGTWKWWIKRPSDAAEVLYMDYTGPTTAGGKPNTEFGYYGAANLSNEVVISDLRVTQH